MTRAGKAIGASLAMIVSLGFAGTPAQAASQMTITHSIQVTGYVRHQIDVHLPMSREDAAGYIYWGARIELECWGEEVGPDEYLYDVPGVGPTFTGTPKRAPYPPGHGVLRATEDGVRLTTLDVYPKGEALNEDYGLQDEIYCKAKWIDADGGTLKAKSNVVSGYF
ncbi:hypothetical protein [Herbidospora sp. RD11066]